MQAVSGFSIAALCSFLGAIGGQDGWDRYLEGVARNVSRLSNPCSGSVYSMLDECLYI